MSKPGDVPSPDSAEEEGDRHERAKQSWESVFAGPETTATPGDPARYEEKAAESSDQGRFED